MTVADAQIAEDVQAIKALIQAFFDTINDADTKALQSLFVRSATTTIIRQDPPLPPPSSSSSSSSSPPSSSPLGAPDGHHDADGVNDDEGPDEKITVLLRTSIERLIKLLDNAKKHRKDQPGHQPVIHEAPDLEATDVKVDALFATAWSPFTVTFDGKLHHYGTMVFVLTKGPTVEGDEEKKEDGDASSGGGTDEGGRVWRVEGLTQNYRRTPGWPRALGEGRRLFTTW